jgi:hypothetical protein
MPSTAARTAAAVLLLALSFLTTLNYWSRWSSAASEADKSSAALLFRGGLNAARIARDMALSLLPGI